MPRLQLLPAALLMLGALSSCHSLHPADLLFHIVEQGNAITDVTPGMIDHVAVYAGNDSVIEAIPRQGVVMTPLSAVFSREDGCYVAAHVHHVDRHRTLILAKGLLGLPYDSLYLPTTEAIYCSELAQLSFVNRRGEPLFTPIPMSFHDSTGCITPYWQQFYDRHGMPVPEGQPGTNPGELSRRPQVKILKNKKY